MSGSGRVRRQASLSAAETERKLLLNREALRELNERLTPRVMILNEEAEHET